VFTQKSVIFKYNRLAAKAPAVLYYLQALSIQSDVSHGVLFPLIKMSLIHVVHCLMVWDVTMWQGVVKGENILTFVILIQPD